MILMADLEIPTRVIVQQLASAIKLVVQVSRLQDGTRKILYISEVLGAEEDHVIVQDIFRFERTGVSEAGKVQGYFHCVNNTPKVLERLKIAGVKLDASVFDERLEINMQSHGD